MLFVDYQRAFDSLNGAWIWEELKVRGLPSKFINIIKEGYEDFRCRVIHEGQISDQIKTSSGVRQGCLPSPLLFLLVLDGVLCRALEGKKRGLTWRLKESLKDMEYADDICLVSHKYEHMQKKLDDLQEESKKVGLQINPMKTEEIRVNTIINRVLKLNGEEIKKSPDFCYLGSVVAEDGGARSDVNVRIQEARGSFSKLRKVWVSTSI
jgi:hypothetical protein